MASLPPSVIVLPLSLQAEPGMVGVRLLVCQREWEPLELDGKLFTLLAAGQEFAPLPFRLHLEPYWPVELRLDFTLQTHAEPLILRRARGMFSRADEMNLLKQPLYDESERADIMDTCYRAWVERARKLELAFDPHKIRSGESNLAEAVSLLERYLHVRQNDTDASQILQRLSLKKELSRHLHNGDWLRVRRLDTEIRAQHAGWQGATLYDSDALAQAYEALRGGWLEAAEERLSRAAEDGEVHAWLLLARLSASWKRDLPRAAFWYVKYMEEGGPNESVVHEAGEIFDGMRAPDAKLYRGKMLAILAERLVARPDNAEIAETVHRFAEAQADAGEDVSEDFGLLWACYEKAFEHQVAVDRRVERSLLARLERLHARLGNTKDWLRIRRALADLDPGRPEFREQLAIFLEADQQYEAALAAQMALWLPDPLNAARTAVLAESARLAGMRGLAERAEVWHAALQGRLAPCAAQISPEVPDRLLLHPEMRPLAALLRQWGRGNGLDALDRGLHTVLGVLSQEDWRSLEHVAREKPLIPSLEAALIMKGPWKLSAGHPLSISAQLSLDRIEIARAGSLAAGLAAIGAPLWHTGRPLGDLEHLSVPAERRERLHRIREIGRFFIGRLWDTGTDGWDMYPDSAGVDLMEAVYLHGWPDWSTRTFLENTRHKEGIGRQVWRKMEMHVQSYLRLAELPESEITEI